MPGFRTGRPDISYLQAEQAVPLLALLAGGPDAGEIGTGDLAGSLGETVTTTRASAKYVPTELDESAVASVASGEPAVGPLGLLVEVAHTNLILRSNAFTTSPWVDNTGGGLTPAATTAPDGTNTGWHVDLTAGGFYQVLSGLVDAAPYSPSFWIMADDTTGTFNMENAETNSKGQWTIDLALVSATEWERLTPEHPAVTVVHPWVAFANDAGPYFTGSVPRKFYMWGWELEAGAYAHSYVSTAGASATCAKDVVTMDASALTLATWVEASFTPLWGTPSGQYVLDTRDGSGDNGIALFFTGAELTLQVGTDSAHKAISSGATWEAGATYDVRATWDAGELILSVNGDVLASSSGSAVPASHSTLHLGSNFSAGAQLDGYLSNVQFWTGQPPLDD